jgi:protein TonB
MKPGRALPLQSAHGPGALSGGQRLMVWGAACATIAAVVSLLAWLPIGSPMSNDDNTSSIQVLVSPPSPRLAEAIRQPPAPQTMLRTPNRSRTAPAYRPVAMSPQQLPAPAPATSGAVASPVAAPVTAPISVPQTTESGQPDAPTEAEPTPASQDVKLQSADVSNTAPEQTPAPSGADWVAAVIARIDAAKTYPPDARQARLTGTVMVRFWLDSAGRASRIRVAATSGHRLLDRAALEAIARAAPFPPGARPLDGRHMLEVPVIFRLT